MFTQKPVLLLLVAASAAITVVSATTQVSEEMSAAIDLLFARFDADRDGRFDPDEYVHCMVNVFPDMPVAGGDAQASATAPKKHIARKDLGSYPTKVEMAKEYWVQALGTADGDEDGHLSVAEVKAWPEAVPFLFEIAEEL